MMLLLYCLRDWILTSSMAIVYAKFVVCTFESASKHKTSHLRVKNFLNQPGSWNGIYCPFLDCYNLSPIERVLIACDGKKSGVGGVCRVAQSLREGDRHHRTRNKQRRQTKGQVIPKPLNFLEYQNTPQASDQARDSRENRKWNDEANDRAS